MKKIYHVYACDEETGGEVEGMFDEKFDLLWGWALNDAQWRREYMDGFIARLGFTVTHAPKEKQAELEAVLIEYLGG
jgi:hypothetical protein